MLSIPLPQLKRQLEEMLLDLQQLVTALQQLRDLLPEQSEKRITVLILLGRLNDANKKALRGTLDNTALQTEYNSIRADLSDLVAGLETLDFDAEAKAAQTAEKTTGTRQGSVLYRIPHTMPLQQETECVVRIALNDDAIVEEITLDDQVVLKDLSRVSDLMQVELGDPARQPVFSIRSTSPAQQLITDEGYTQWFFYVEPLRDGVHPLEVKVSVLELALNQVHRKELVFRETIQIITAGAPAVMGSDAGFKNAGQTFALEGVVQGNVGNGTEVSKSVEYQPVVAPPEEQKRTSSAMRSVAFSLAFLMLGSTATWAFTPAETRDWWVASILEDTPQAYAAYLEKHPDSRFREKALFFKADQSEQLADLRAYQEYYPTGKYRDRVATRISTMETRAIDNIRQQPSRENIRQFALEFPDSERLSDVKEAADTRKDNRQELLAAVEEVYVTSARTKPTQQKIDAYLRDFPNHDRLNDVTEAAAARPDVMAKVQPVLEEAYLEKMEKDPTSAKATEFLEKFPEPLKQEKFEAVLDKKPAVKKEVIRKLKKMEALRQAKSPEQ
jgi:Effector-associated domain 11